MWLKTLLPMASFCHSARGAPTSTQAAQLVSFLAYGMDASPGITFDAYRFRAGAYLIGDSINVTKVSATDGGLYEYEQ